MNKEDEKSPTGSPFKKSRRQIQMEAQVRSWIQSVISDPQYSPSPVDYMSVAHSVFLLCTAQAPLPTPNLSSPFETFYSFLVQSLDASISSLKPNLALCESHARSAFRRISLIEHVCSRCLKRRLSFVHCVNAPSVTEYGSCKFLQLFDQSKLTPVLLKSAVQDLTYPLFGKSPATSDFSLFRNFISLKEHGSQVNGRDEYPDFLNTTLKPALSACFREFAEVDVATLCTIAPNLYNNISSLGADTNILVRSLFFDTFIHPKLAQIQEQLAAIPPDSLLAVKSTAPERSLLSILTFKHTPESLAIVYSFYERFADGVTSTFPTESNVRALAAAMLSLLQMNEQFRKLVFDPDWSIDKRAKAIMSQALERAVFHDRLGRSYAVALAFVVDTYLKRGQAFKTSVKEHHVIALLAYLSDRDIFLGLHQQFMFVRLATRATIGVDYESTFLSSMAGVVTEANLKDCRALLDEAVEYSEDPVPNFVYRAMRHTFAPPQLQQVPVPLPPEYGRLTDQVQAILKRKFRARAYKWLHHLATADVRISIAGKTTQAVISLAGIAVLGVLAHSPVLPVLELCSQAAVTREPMQKLLQCFRQEGLVTIGTDAGQTVSLNLKWAKPGKQKPILAENWTPVVFAARPIGENRSQATRACIVRIMKHSRMMRYQQLIERTIEEASVIFPIKIADVKFEIQYLIRSHYMEQVDDEHVQYIE
jgi:hypothetical protein